MQSMLLHLVATERDRASEGVRRQAVILLATLAAMAALFLSAGTTYRPDFLSAFARLPEIAGYLLLFSGYIAWSLIRLVLLIGRYVELTDRRWLQRGLRTLQAGAGFGVAWAAHKVVAATTVFLTGVSYPGAELLAVVPPRRPSSWSPWDWCCRPAHLPSPDGCRRCGDGNGIERWAGSGRRCHR
ncbi:hypothetical protein [Saccharomonospora azurea]|uniref:hypothetical protein n=1 Tax=Saccharomonospora azurea TaxID=40988 RepID=UPI003D8BB1CA